MGRTVTFTLGTGSAGQTCSGTTDPTGAASCTVADVNQPAGPVPVTATFASDGYYLPASAAATVNLPEGTVLTLTPASGTFNGTTALSGTLFNTYTSQPVSGQTVTLTVSASQSCSGVTNANGVATCTITPNEPAGTYSYTGSFGGSTTQTPQLLPTSGSNTFVVTQAPTTLTYTGPTSLTNGQPVTLTGLLTTNEPTPGTDLSGQTVTLDIGSGGSSQSCTGTTGASGVVSCTISSVSQSTGSVAISGSYAGNSYYQSAQAASSASVHTPTTLSVSAVSAMYGSPTTVTGTLTNSVTGQPIAGEPVTLTLNGSQSCSATTASNGTASCTITPNEAAGSYTVSASFGGDSTKSPQLLPSGGSNTAVVSKAPTSASYTGPSVAVSGMPTTLSANLTRRWRTADAGSTSHFDAGQWQLGAELQRHIDLDRRRDLHHCRRQPDGRIGHRRRDLCRQFRTTSPRAARRA